MAQTSANSLPSTGVRVARLVAEGRVLVEGGKAGTAAGWCKGRVHLRRKARSASEPVAGRRSGVLEGPLQTAPSLSRCTRPLHRLAAVPALLLCTSTHPLAIRRATCAPAEGELLALVWAIVGPFPSYLHMAEFEVYPDNQCLKYLFGATNLGGGA